MKTEDYKENCMNKYNETRLLLCSGIHDGKAQKIYYRSCDTSRINKFFKFLCTTYKPSTFGMCL
ncbi:hypothetical protein CWB31_15125 [Bacillus cereus]|nr:hypothetical protein [Bacillus cereus]MBR9687716.1 hypothetical protein [Bacillus cereus]QFR28423.1 hypothetical protein FQZ25_11345 [Bacillus thuringiensis]